MKIFYDGMYHIELDIKDSFHLSADNINKVKQIWLNIMSEKFDEEVNNRLGEYGMENNNIWTNM